MNTPTTTQTINREARAKLIRKPWSRQDAIREKRRREARERLFDRFRTTGRV